MTSFVVDASILVELTVGTPESRARIAEIVQGSRLIAPHLIDIELASALRRLTRLGAVTPAQAESALWRIADSSALHRYEHRPLLTLVWSMRHEITAYDASYVALAQITATTLVTQDRKLAAAALGRCEIVVPSQGTDSGAGDKELSLSSPSRPSRPRAWRAPAP